MEKFQEKYSFLEDYQELKQYVLKNRGNYNEKNELMTTISALKIVNRVAATIFKHKIYKKKHIEEEATEVNNRFFIFENEYPIAEQEI